jgi:hypothetical protein
MEKQFSQKQLDLLEIDEEAEFDNEGECAVCGMKGVYNIEEVGALCPNCAEQFVP